MTLVDQLPKHPVRRRMALQSRQDQRRTRLAVRVEPEVWQEPHSPTAPVEVRLTGSKVTTIARRRKSDARLWDAMSPHQQEAATAIARTFEQITAGSGAKAQTYDRSGKSGYIAPSTAQIEAQEDYWRWAKLVQVEKLSHAAVVDILILGDSCRMVDSSRHKRKGWAIENLLACLNSYCLIKGWPTK